MSFKAKFLLVIAVTVVVGTIISTLIAASSVRSAREEALLEKSRAILSRIEEVRTFVASQGGFKDLVGKAVEKYPDGNLPKSAKEEILMHVPVYATMVVARRGAEKDNYQFRVFSDEPRNKDNQATASEQQILERFGADPKLKELVEKKDNKFYVYRPVRLSEKYGCLACHGNPATSPFHNGNDILGYKMENWKDGKLHAAFAIISDMTPVQQASAKASWTIAGFSGLVGLLSILIAFLLVRKPLNRLSQVANHLTQASGEIQGTGQEIASSAQNLSAASVEAAASIQETTASVEEISSMIKLNAEHAQSAKDLSEKSEKEARQGADEVQKLILAMDEISKASAKIGEITGVIDDIAFQTNLLALNAAVEAARAGEQGRGFAVVAEAVRALAQRSSSSAKEISELIRDSISKVKVGSEQVEKSGVLLTEIVQTIEKVSHLNHEISSASSEQSVGLVNISKAVNEMDKVTQQNAGGAQDAAASAVELSEQAEKLNSIVRELQNVLYGGTNSSESPSVKKSASRRDGSNQDIKNQFLPLEEGSKSSNLKSVESFDTKVS